MNKKKYVLYASAGIAWVFIVLCTLSQDHKNIPYADYGYQTESKEIALNSEVSMIYGPLATGDTQVTLKCGLNEVNAIVPERLENMNPHSVFPAGEKHIGMAFQNKNNLDTVVLFNSKESQVFYHVIAMDSDSGMIACLQSTQAETLNLVITTFENKVVKTVELKNHAATFLDDPKINAAAFTGSVFKLDTAFGSYLVPLAPLPSLI